MRILFRFALILSAMTHCLGEDTVDLQNLVVYETQQLEQGPGTFRIVWWIPTEYRGRVVS